MVAYLIYFLKVRQLIAADKMKRKIERELHDDIGAALGSINLLSSLATEKIKADPLGVNEFIAKISDNSARMMDVMDDVIWSSNPANSSTRKIEARMREFASTTLEPADISFTYNFDPALNQIHLNLEQRRDIFLFFKEIIINAAKHSSCNYVDINIYLKDGIVWMGVMDNGIGFDINNCKEGNGLRKMKQYADDLKGNLHIDSDQNGTIITLVFPRSQ
jgi:Signal transduction histidine kinase